MRKLFIFLLLVNVGNAFAQPIFPSYVDTNKNVRMIDLTGSMEIATSAIDNGIINPFLFGGNISSATIDRNFSRQRMLNRGGAIISGELNYTDLKVNLFKSEKIGFGVRVGYSQVANMSYTDHLFGLVFKGNEQYAGKNLDLTSTGFENVGFEKVGFGIFLKKSRSSFFVNLVNVSGYNKGGISHGTIIQSDSLDDFTFDVKGSYTQRYQPKFFGGMGLSLDMDYNIPMRFLKNDHAILQVRFRDLGFAYIAKGLKRYAVDSIEHFQGFTVQQLSDGIISADKSLMDTLGVKTGSADKYILLPFYVQISKSVNEDYEGKFQSLFGLRAYPLSNYRPLIYAGVDYRPIHPLHIGLMASYGGFSNFRGTIYLQYQIKQFGIGIGCDNIVGMVSKKGFGQTYNFQLVCRF